MILIFVISLWIFFKSVGLFLVGLYCSVEFCCLGVVIKVVRFLLSKVVGKVLGFGVSGIRFNVLGVVGNFLRLWIGDL